MSGHYGCEKVTTQNLLVLAIDKDNNTITIKGNVPGPINQILKIKNSIKNKKTIVIPNLIIKATPSTSPNNDMKKENEKKEIPNKINNGQQNKFIATQQKEQVKVENEGK